MEARWIKKSLCILCILCLGLAVVATAQNKAPSVLDRVQKVDHPELGELIQAAIENRKNITQKETMELIRKVTLSYVQIKLLDQQIQEVSRKMKAETGPAELQYELLLAKTELESKLMAELANLREIMGIIPKHAFEKQPIHNLNTWLSLNVIGERVYVLDGLKAFSGYWARQRWRSAGLLSERETLDYVRGRLQSNSSLPVRIDIYHVPSTKTSAEGLRSKIISLAKEANSQMETEVNLILLHWVGSGESTFYLREGTIRTLYPVPVQRPDRGPKSLVSGLVKPNDLEQHILWRLLHPGNVPLKFRIEYDEASALSARQVAETARAIAKRLGIADVVEVVEALVEPVPEAVFQGRWQAVTDIEIREIELQAGGQSRLTMRTGRTGQTTACAVDCPVPPLTMRTGRTGQTTLPAPWTLTTKEIFIDSSHLVTYRGYINAEGNLLIQKGQIYPQGSWHEGRAALMVFAKVQ